MTAASGSVKAKPRVLVTGASGRIGRYVVSELLERGYQVRALTTKPVETVADPRNKLEWRRFDWHNSLSFDPLVQGCAAVLHLGAELYQIEKMQRSNIDAVRFLVRASEQVGIKFFCYVSSVAVYGSSLEKVVTEDSPVLTSDRDIRSQYFADDALRAYGRTKLAGELALQDEANRVSCTILRPTVVVDIPDLVELASWSNLKKAMAGYRHSHQIYVLDVVHAMLWFMEKCLAGDASGPTVSVYNLSNDDVIDNTYANFFREAFRCTSDRRFKTVQLPAIFDRTRDVLKFRMPPVRHSLGAMRFSPAKLYSTGYRHRFGIKEAHRRALDLLVSG